MARWKALKCGDYVLGFFGPPLPFIDQALELLEYTVGDEGELIDENGNYTDLYYDDLEYLVATDDDFEQVRQRTEGLEPNQ